MNPSFVQYGFGAAGREIVRQAVAKGLRLAGVIDRDPGLLGRDAGEVLALGQPLGVIVGDDAAACLKRAEPDAVLHAAPFDPPAMMQQLALVAAAGADAVSLAGLSHPWQRYPDMAQRLDRVAREAGVTVLGTGYVPGFLTDVLPILLSGAVHRIRRLRVLRVSDFSPWGRSVLQRYGFGLPEADFAQRLRDDQLRLFATLWQSLDMLVAALDWKIEDQGEERGGFASRRRRVANGFTVEAGAIGGFRHCIFARQRDGASIELEARGFLQPEGEEERPRLVIEIEGEPSGRFELSGEMAEARGSLLASAARVVNAIPTVLAAPPGLLTLAQVPPTAAYRSAWPSSAGAAVLGEVPA